MTKQVDVYLADILQSIALIEKYVADTPYSRIQTDTETQDAIIRRLEIIGEAVKQLPDDVRAKHPHIPWKQIAGMRDVLFTRTQMLPLSGCGVSFKMISNY